MNHLVGKSTGIALLMAAALIAALFSMGVFSATGVGAHDCTDANVSVESMTHTQDRPMADRNEMRRINDRRAHQSRAFWITIPAMRLRWTFLLRQSDRTTPEDGFTLDRRA